MYNLFDKLEHFTVLGKIICKYEMVQLKKLCINLL
jgi:hypothetical protein